MKRWHSISYLIVLLIAILAACGPNAAGTPSTPVGGDASVPTVVAIQHQLTPVQLPDDRSGHAGDQDSSLTANQKRAASGDRFTFGQFERPFNSDTMDTYYPYLDIQDVYIYQDDSWIYAVITVKGRDANSEMPGKYAVELDLDVDGRGDLLVMVSHPASADWTTDGVQVWADRNKDVGGSVALNADKTPSKGDGYETQVFDQGHGDDPDAAWARLPADNLNSIQLAVKRTLLEGDSAYLAGMWAGNDQLNPALFDLNDHFTHDQAGEAMKELEYYYPIKQISEVDNTCRMAVGFTPQGDEPGLCRTYVAPGGETACQPPPAGCDTSSGFKWDTKKCCCNYENLGCNYSP
ncbi:MAG TPA: hypothetical protein VHM28_09805 [Anaerolineales bacterium]|nr:hypothetical protein [Anaerolineales bacterium]